MIFKILCVSLCVALLASQAHGTFDGSDRFYEYVAYRKDLSFFKAWQTCRLQGGNIASISSYEENIRVLRAISQKGSLLAKWYIGATDIGYEGRFFWIGLNKELLPTSYTNFATGQPSASSSSDDCLVMSIGGKWSDAGCDGVTGYVCAYRSIH
ncbi:low affinity immunoglobulin epsilon Fc receptor-like [Anopheles nili]|uniref:low affinity immunoglobulin epsilon Fc receptor-like n=1 Tax=Anopheles nili TaxID=185578 RepID=UPI00237B7BC1|nr:low affinity immunoglobulin epsilon Fc receptor-like [Anopheles nili]